MNFFKTSAHQIHMPHKSMIVYYFAVQSSIEIQPFMKHISIWSQISVKHFFHIEETIYSNLGVL